MPKFTQAAYTTKCEVELSVLHQLMQDLVSRAYRNGYKHGAMGVPESVPVIRKEHVWKLQKRK